MFLYSLLLVLTKYLSERAEVIKLSNILVFHDKISLFVLILKLYEAYKIQFFIDHIL